VTKGLSAGPNLVEKGTMKTYLTLSEVPSDITEAGGSPAADLAPPWDSTAYAPRSECDAIANGRYAEVAGIGESELRALWGDR
jgi:hypothetical protein